MDVAGVGRGCRACPPLTTHTTPPLPTHCFIWSSIAVGRVWKREGGGGGGFR